MPHERLRIAALVVAVCGCDPALAEPPLTLKLDPRLSEAPVGNDDDRPVFASGDRLSGRTDRDISLQGQAQLRRSGTVVRGDRITYYVPEDEVVAVGNVRVVREGNVFTGPAVQLRLDGSEGVFLSPSYTLGLYGGRGRAERIEFLDDKRVAMRDATYTTCRADDPDWFLRTESLELDNDREEGFGKWASLVFKGRQVLAAPMFTFPTGDRRRSGFLPPSFAYTSRTGPEFVAPYYLDIAPNRDLTLYPRAMVRRGFQLGGQFRYLEPWSNGDMRMEYTPNDSLTGTNRYFWSSLNSFSNVGGWSGSVNARGVSDDNYFVDYSRSILASSDRVLPRDITAIRYWNDWTVLLRATRYQTILDARLAPPYERVPQINLTHQRRDLLGFDLETMLDASRFRRALDGSAEGVRLVAHPRISYPIVRPGWFVIPRAGIHLSSYRMESLADAPTSLSRAVPSFSLDAGLVYERASTFFGRDLTQTLEPRLFYVRTPYRNQSAFPVFDTAVADFNFAQLFSENTFVGNDRMADQNQLTTAVVSRLVEPATGVESLRFALGQRYYFSDQRVSIPGVLARTDTRSDVLLAAAANLGGGMSVDAGLQYSVRDSSVPRLNLLYRYLPGDGRILNAGVRYLRNELGQIDTSWRWPVADRWVALGRINYSFLHRRTDPATLQLVDAKRGIIEGVAGFEYSADCWTTRLVMQRFVTAAGQSTSTFFLQLELSGLGRIGSDPFDILRRNIPGYRLPNDRPTLPSRYFGYE